MAGNKTITTVYNFFFTHSSFSIGDHHPMK